ncbi:MAG: hypothetical protein RL215_1301, partial [Planctomycetota bacterium]
GAWGYFEPQRTQRTQRVWGNVGCGARLGVFGRNGPRRPGMGAAICCRYRTARAVPLQIESESWWHWACWAGAGMGVVQPSSYEFWRGLRVCLVPRSSFPIPRSSCLVPHSSRHGNLGSLCGGYGFGKSVGWFFGRRQNCCGRQFQINRLAADFVRVCVPGTLGARVVGGLSGRG